MVLQTGTVDWVVFDSAVLSLCLVDSYLSEQIMLEIPELIGQKNCFQCITISAFLIGPVLLRTAV